MLLKQSTARNLAVFMTDSADHVSGKVGLTLTITASKDGAAFASITPTVTELANGWYSLALTTTHTNTLGDLAIHITSAGADPTDLVRQVVTDLPGVAQTGDAYARLGAPAGASVSADIAAVKGVLPAALVSGRIDASVGAMVANVLTAAAINADAITAAKIADGAIDAATFAAGAINATAIAADAITDAKVASDVTIASVTGAVGSVTGNVGGNVTGSVGSVSGMTASDVGAIKAKTDNLPSDPADESLIIAATDAVMARLGAPAGASMSADIAAVKSDSGAIKAKTDNLPAAPAAVGDIPTAAAISDVVWDEATSGHAIAGSTGKALTDAGGAGTPLDAAGVRAAIGMASANLDTQLAAVQADTDNIQTRLPAALVGGRMDSSVGAMAANVLTAAAINADAITAAKIADGAIDAPTFAAGAINAAAIAADAIGASELAADAAAEIAAAVRSELSTELGRVDAAVSTRLASGGYTAPDNASVTAIKAKTDNLPSDPAGASDIAVAFATVNASLSTIAGYIDTEVATLVSRLGAPAGASIAADIAAAFARLGAPAGASLAADAAAIKAVADAVKAKTDNLPADPAGVTTILNTALAESYAADGSAPTLRQFLFMIWAYLANKEIAVDTLTALKLDGTTPAMTFALDSGATPTSQTRAT